MSRFKKWFICISLLVFCVASNGCGAELNSWVDTDLSGDLIQRIGNNKEIADDLYESGFITQNDHDAFIQQLDEVEKNIRKMGESKGNTGSLEQAVVASRVYGNEGGDWGVPIHTSDGGTVMGYLDDSSTPSVEHRLEGCQHWTDHTHKASSIYPFIAGNYIYKVKHGVSVGDNGDWVLYKSENPIDLVSDKASSTLKDRLKFEVYVLNPKYITNEANEFGIDGIIEAIRNSVKFDDSNNRIVDDGVLNNYFIPALGDDGKPITLFDVDDMDSWLFRETTDNLSYSDNGIGKDLVCRQRGCAQISVRLREFNPEFVELMKNTLQAKSGKYLFYSGTAKDSTGASTNKVYLMEYPVYYYKSFKEGADNTVEGVLERSQISINIYNGKIVKAEGGTYDLDVSGDYIPDTITPYYTVSGADNENEESRSSFILKGVAQIPVGFKLAEGVGVKAQSNVSTGRIILRDYLELTYAPECSSTCPEDNLVAFGRKIRITPTKWEERDEVPANVQGSAHATEVYKNIMKQSYPIFQKSGTAAIFVDKDGVVMDESNKQAGNSMQLRVTDFADFESLNDDSDPQVKYISEMNEESVGRGFEYAESDRAKVNELPSMRGSQISPTNMFPSDELDAVDYNSDSVDKQRFYGIATKTTFFDTALFSQWVNSTHDTQSLEYWNGYLEASQMAYRVDHNEVNAYLENNYSYELTQEGIVVLDLEVVSKIQDEFDQDKDDQRNRFITTSIKVLGWVLIGYAMVLALAWVLDINADIGIKLLGKFTLGHWVAIKYKSDIPYYDGSSRVYVTMSGIIIKCMIIIVIGVLLLRVNVFHVVLLLINMFGRLAESVEKVIRGLR